MIDDPGLPAWKQEIPSLPAKTLATPGQGFILWPKMQDVAK
jgi:hypothetical protein